MTTHEFLIPQADFEAIACGDKQHELLRGIEYEVGDIFRFKERSNGGTPTGRELETEVTYITSEKNHCALSPQALGCGHSIVSFRLRQSATP